MTAAKTILTLSVLLGAYIPSSYGQEAESSGVDNVLERLERQILSDEADGFSHPGLRADNEGDGLTDPTAPIGGNNLRTRPKAQAADFSAILNNVKNLGKEIERLSSDVHQYKQAAVVASKDNTYVYVEASILDSAKNNLKSIRVKIDGFTVYDIRDTAGLWMPSAAIPLYSGPLIAGNHRIEVDASVGQVQGEGLPVNGPVYRNMQQTFDIKIPLSSANKKYILSIAPVTAGSDKNTDAGLTLKEAM